MPDLPFHNPRKIVEKNFCVPCVAEVCFLTHVIKKQRTGNTEKRPSQIKTLCSRAYILSYNPYGHEFGQYRSASQVGDKLPKELRQDSKIDSDFGLSFKDKCNVPNVTGKHFKK